MHVGKKGAYFDVTQAGTIKFQALDGSEVSLQNVMYYPEGPGTFISVSKLEKQGLHFTFANAKVKVKDVNGIPLFQGERKGMLYFINQQAIAPPAT